MSAVSYMKAGQLLYDSLERETHWEMPARMCFYHSIELFLKGFLLVSGSDINYIKNKLGHKLLKIFRECREFGLDISEELESCITLIETDMFESRYVKTGYKEVLSLESLIDLNILLHKRTKQHYKLHEIYTGRY